MLQTVSAADIKQRATAINLTLAKLARRAGISPACAYRGPRTVEKLTKLNAALMQIEDRAFEHLARERKRRQGQLDMEGAR